MPIELSDPTWTLLCACFCDAEQVEGIAARLESELDFTVDGALNDRIRFSIIRLIVAAPDTDHIDAAFDLAKLDWRDLLVAASHAEDTEAHQVWAAKMIRQRPQIFVETPITLNAVVDDRGWVTCRNCDFRFKLSNPQAWDEVRHRRCGQRLQID